MIRSLWLGLFIVVTTAIHGTVAIVVALLRIKRRPNDVYDWSTVDWSRGILQVAGTPVLASGLELVPREGPVVFASNHTSMFDIWALSATLPGSTRFVAKQELGRIPLLGPAMRRAGHILIDRFNRARAFEAYDQAAATIRSGISAIVFPEGTRSRTRRSHSPSPRRSRSSRYTWTAPTRSSPRAPCASGPSRSACWWVSRSRRPA